MRSGNLSPQGHRSVEDVGDVPAGSPAHRALGGKVLGDEFHEMYVAHQMRSRGPPGAAVSQSKSPLRRTDMSHVDAGLFLQFAAGAAREDTYDRIDIERRVVVHHELLCSAKLAGDLVVGTGAAGLFTGVIR
ncbi:hypothetical protein N601_31505 [Rhodococcus erythropolis DN1]|nr:hypothetical protein N601_31505 [Rhodococcus erythropolis DN1]